MVEAPPGATELQLTTNLGSIEGLARTGEGRYSARYLPPAWTYPQVAILTAVAHTPAGLVWGWSRLPLYGQGDAVVKTKPGASITVRIGEQQYGPVVADARGVALVPVVVPPGVTHAFQGTQPIDLGVPETTRLHLALQPLPLRADAPANLEVLVFAVSPQGEIRKGGAPKLSASRGTVEPLASAGPGVFRTRWSLPAGKPGKVELKATLADEQEPGRLTVVIPPGPPAKLALAVAPKEVVAGQTHELTAEVTMADSAGNPTSAPLTLEPSLARLIRDEELGPGRRRLTVGIEPGFGGARELQLKVLAPGGASAQATLALRPGPLTRLKVVAPPLRADGSVVQLTVRPEDGFGNLVSSAGLQLEVSPGAIEEVTAQPDGSFEVRYRAPRVLDGAAATLRVRLDSLVEEHRLELSPPGLGFAAAVKLGGLSNLSDVTAPSLGLEALVTRLPLAGLAVALEGARFAFGPDPRARSPLFPDAEFTGLQQYWALSLAALYRLPVPGPLLWEGRIGGGLTYVRSRLRTPEQPALVEASWVPQGYLGVGLLQKVWRGAATLELRAGVHADPGLAILSGPLYSVQLLLGYRFDLR